MTRPKAVLVLEDGRVYTGTPFGARTAPFAARLRRR